MVRRQKVSGSVWWIGTHVRNLNISGGYKVHFDHGAKGKGTANVPASLEYYRDNNHFSLINLHITAGKVGQERTEMLLGPYSDRTEIVGYPKADVFLKLNTRQNKMSVYKELGFDLTKPLITYAPAGEEGYMKPGGSLTEEAIDRLREISEKNGYNILIKLKYPGVSFPLRMLGKLKRLAAGVWE